MKNEWKKGWKVIQTKKNKIRTRISCTNIAFPVKYLKNKITRRPERCGPLAVFKTRKLAREFSKKGFWTNRKIVKCLYVSSEDTQLWRPSWHAPSKYLRSCDLPEGTILADKVKCLE